MALLKIHWCVLACAGGRRDLDLTPGKGLESFCGGRRVLAAS